MEKNQLWQHLGEKGAHLLDMVYAAGRSFFAMLAYIFIMLLLKEMGLSLDFWAYMIMGLSVSAGAYWHGLKLAKQTNLEIERLER